MLAEDGFMDGGEDYTDEELEIIESKAICPVCDSDVLPMGTLGKLVWYRCQYCGMEFSKRKDE